MESKANSPITETINKKYLWVIAIIISISFIIIPEIIGYQAFDNLAIEGAKLIFLILGLALIIGPSLALKIRDDSEKERVAITRVLILGCVIFGLAILIMIFYNQI